MERRRPRSVCPIERQRQQRQDRPLQRTGADAGAEPAGGDHVERHHDERGEQQVGAAAHAAPCANSCAASATAASAVAPMRNCLTRGSRRRAMTDSTTPISDGHRRHAEHEAERLQQRTRAQHADEQRRGDEQLHGAAVLDERQVRTGVIEHHHLVQHRQLEMRGRVVDGDARVLGEQHRSRAPRHRAAGPGCRRRGGRAAERGEDASPATGAASRPPAWRAPGRAPARPARRRRLRGSRPCLRSCCRCRAPPPSS